jgi:hypothetical protein
MHTQCNCGTENGPLTQALGCLLDTATVRAGATFDLH